MMFCIQFFLTYNVSLNTQSTTHLLYKSSTILYKHTPSYTYMTQKSASEAYVEHWAVGIYFSIYLLQGRVWNPPRMLVNPDKNVRLLVWSQ